MITCPFCLETDFDRSGLKNHLVMDCLEFGDIQTDVRVFARSGRKSACLHEKRRLSTDPNTAAVECLECGEQL